MSASKEANIPNSFEKLSYDLNAANLRIELKRLRQASKLEMADGDEEVPDAKGDEVAGEGDKIKASAAELE